MYQIGATQILSGEATEEVLSYWEEILMDAKGVLKSLVPFHGVIPYCSGDNLSKLIDLCNQVRGYIISEGMTWRTFQDHVDYSQPLGLAMALFFRDPEDLVYVDIHRLGQEER
ncbi:hypothetical protein LJC07_05575 [Christensenellaceae bacterium OttesenSCG-928-L17]|nr:hypothetical protein [Christensenellaceae bacterium OttesenSCG-928-L17]